METSTSGEVPAARTSRPTFAVSGLSDNAPRCPWMPLGSTDERSVCSGHAREWGGLKRSMQHPAWWGSSRLEVVVHRLTPDQKRVIAAAAARRVPSRRIARRSVDRIARSMTMWMRCADGHRRVRCRSDKHLSLAERERSPVAWSRARSLRSIASGLGREPSTVCREVSRNGGRRRYRATRAEDRAWACGRRPKQARSGRRASSSTVEGEASELGRHRSRSLAGWS